MNKVLSVFLFAFVLILSACGGETSENETAKAEGTPKQDSVEQEEAVEVEEVKEPSPKEMMIAKIVELINEGSIFDTGSYIKGDIPKGDYAFVSFEGSGEYYGEEDSAGEIVDNENFASFGYVHVHEVGNIETRGILVKIDALQQLGVTGAKELYEILNETEDYMESGYYKVGVDLAPGEYIFESQGSGYIGVESGPVGNSDIIKNENFDGRYSTTVSEGQYLDLSRALISK